MSSVSENVLRTAMHSAEVRRGIAELVVQTPALESRMPLPDGTRLIYKCENFQKTGSFKLRGASAKLSSLPLDRPVVTASSGNHGIACSATAKRTGHQLTVVLPETVVAEKRQKIESYGTRVVIAGADSELSERHAKQLAAEEGEAKTFPGLRPRRPPIFPWRNISTAKSAV